MNRSNLRKEYSIDLGATSYSLTITESNLSSNFGLLGFSPGGNPPSTTSISGALSSEI